MLPLISLISILVKERVSWWGGDYCDVIFVWCEVSFLAVPPLIYCVFASFSVVSVTLVSLPCTGTGSRVYCRCKHTCTHTYTHIHTWAHTPSLSLSLSLSLSQLLTHTYTHADIMWVLYTIALGLSKEDLRSVPSTLLSTYCECWWSSIEGSWSKTEQPSTQYIRWSSRTGMREMRGREGERGGERGRGRERERLCKEKWWHFTYPARHALVH